MASDDKTKGADGARIERELRRGRAFSIGEAIGREGGGLMRGATIVPRTEQVAAAARQLIDDGLDDITGCARRLLAASVADDLEALERHHDAPAGAVLEHVARILASEAALQGFVRRVDADWGRLMAERPHFERPGRPPDPEDEYTHASVRAALERLVASLDDPDA